MARVLVVAEVEADEQLTRRDLGRLEGKVSGVLDGDDSVYAVTDLDVDLERRFSEEETSLDSSEE